MKGSLEVPVGGSGGGDYLLALKSHVYAGEDGGCRRVSVLQRRSGHLHAGHRQVLRQMAPC